MNKIYKKRYGRYRINDIKFVRPEWFITYGHKQISVETGMYYGSNEDCIELHGRGVYSDDEAKIECCYEEDVDE